MSDTLAVPRYRHRNLVIAGALGFAAMLGVVVSLTRGVAPPADPYPKVQVPQKPIADTPPVVTAAPALPPPEIVPAVDDSEAPPAPPSDIASVPAAEPSVPRPRRRMGKADAPGRNRGDSAKRNPPSPPALPPKAAAPCDPFDYAHAEQCKNAEKRSRQN